MSILFQGDALCKECFYYAFEEEIHKTIVDAKLFTAGETVAIGASGGKGTCLRDLSGGKGTCLGDLSGGKGTCLMIYQEEKVRVWGIYQEEKVCVLGIYRRNDIVVGKLSTKCLNKTGVTRPVWYNSLVSTELL